MSGSTKIGDEDLHAYIDGEVHGDQAAVIENAIAQDSVLAARVAAFRSDKIMLGQFYQPLVHQPLPARWIDMARAPSRTHWPVWGAIAATLLIVAAAVGPYLFAGPFGDRDVVSVALEARTNSITANSFVPKTVRVRSEDVSKNISDVIGSKVKIPFLGRMGFQFAGFQLYERAAEILYRDKVGHVFTVYLSPSNGTTVFDQFGRGRTRVCVWKDEKLSLVMAGDISAAMMQRLASLTYIGLYA